MISYLHVPYPPLSEFISHFYYYKDFNPVHSLDRFLPDAEVQLIFDFTDTPKLIYDNESLEQLQTCRKVWFSGFRTMPITIPSGQNSEMLIVQMKKGRVLPFINCPMDKLTNLVVDAELVFHRELLSVRDQLLEIKEPAMKCIKLEEFFIDFYSDRLLINPFIDFAVDTICKGPTQVSIQKLSEEIGFTQKHLIDIVKSHLGVTPKAFLKVIRFQTVLNQAAKNKNINWIDVAHDCGFYDQSHFIAEFKKFSGFTPTEYVKHKGESSHYVPVSYSG